MKLTKTLKLSAAAFTLFAAAPLLAEEAPAPHLDTTGAAEATTAATASGPAMWKVADEDTTIYLFGTVHILPKDIEWFDVTISDALAKSDMIVTEVPMDPKSEAEMATLVQKMGMLPPGTKLRSLLNKQQRASYEAAFSKLGLPPQMADRFDAFKPWFAGLNLSMLPMLVNGYSPEMGVEKVLLAKAGDKPQGALETAAFQFSIFDNLPEDKQIAFLIQAAEGVGEATEMLNRMVSEWVKGDADTLAAIMNEGMDDPVLMDALLHSRNANWAEWIANRMDQPGTVFIAVGAGHLAGEKSVQELLAAKGIVTMRVK
ncbi:MAG: TraB/GumN family protein [Erythrobacter sp.]